MCILWCVFFSYSLHEVVHSRDKTQHTTVEEGYCTVESLHHLQQSELCVVRAYERLCMCVCACASVRQRARFGKEIREIPAFPCSSSWCVRVCVDKLYPRAFTCVCVYVCSNTSPGTLVRQALVGDRELRGRVNKNATKKKTTLAVAFGEVVCVRANVCVCACVRV